MAGNYSGPKANCGGPKGNYGDPKGNYSGLKLNGISMTGGPVPEPSPAACPSCLSLISIPASLPNCYGGGSRACASLISSALLNVSHMLLFACVCLRAMLLFNDCCLTHASSNASCDTRVCFRSAHFVRAYACMRFVEHYHV